MCNAKSSKYASVPQEVIHAPTYADAQTQSAVANANKAKKNSNIKTSARGVAEENTEKTEKAGLFAPEQKQKKKTLGE